jgi:hypothetical protein
MTINKEELLPDYGDLMSLQDFVKYCKEGYFIDYDGIGYYSDGRVYWRDLIARPSDIIKDRIKNGLNYRYVIWFNK